MKTTEEAITNVEQHDPSRSLRYAKGIHARLITIHAMVIAINGCMDLVSGGLMFALYEESKVMKLDRVREHFRVVLLGIFGSLRRRDAFKTYWGITELSKSTKMTTVMAEQIVLLPSRKVTTYL